jgi:microcystin-dependent protein
MLILGAPRVQMFKNGKFLEGGKIYTYNAGTDTPRATYPTWDDATAETNANANPVILDARGEASVVLKGSTKVTVADENDFELWSIDDLDSSSIDITGIDGGNLLTFTGVVNAVNHFQISNSAQGDEVVLEVVGDDTNISLEIKCKGTGDFSIVNSDLELEVGNLTITSGNITVTSGDVNIPDGTINLTDGEIILGSNGVFTFAPAGMLMWYGGSSVPDGWLECNGAAVSRTTYETLFTNIGTAFGAGDTSTTFNLPNQARRILVGKGGSSSGTLGSSIGSTGGEETHTLSTEEIPSHTHTYTEWTHYGTYASEGDQSSGSLHNYGNPFDQDTFSTGNTGGGGSHNIMQPSLVLMLLIRAF